MPTYILLSNWTEQGIKNVKDSPKRLDAGRAMAKQHGCELTDFYMTMGPYDMVAVLDAPDDEAAARHVLALGAGGNIRTTTLKAFPEATYRSIIAELG
ncbi:MAG TPA: GYD domain-containing protein [Casimicrobiaceae bacterium]|jgi:uncharacterized protein with GYD domain